MYIFVLMMLCAVKSMMALSTPSNPFLYDLGVKIVGKSTNKSELTICAHGYGHSNQIVDVINAMHIFDHQLVGFNFPDYGIMDAFDHANAAYGTIHELLPLLHVLKLYACDQKIQKINLYGFSAGGGAVVNALVILNNYSYAEHLKKINLTQDNAQSIINALAKGIVILECPLKSVQEIIDFRGTSKNLLLMANNYNKNNLNPIDTVLQLKNFDMNILLCFVQPDEVLSNRDDMVFVERLKKGNSGKTHFVTSASGGHVGYHPELWAYYNKMIG